MWGSLPITAQAPSQKDDTDMGVTAHHTQVPSQKDTDVGVTAHRYPGPITEG